MNTPTYTEFFLGKKTSVPGQTRFAYISQYQIRCDEVVPVLLKAKKDGSVSKLRDYVVSYEKMELA